MISAEAADETAQLQQAILARARRQCSAPRTPLIIWRQEHHSESDIAVSFYLLYYCAPLTSLLVQDDCFESDPLQKSRNGLAHPFVVSVNHEYLTRRLQSD